jgi:hypothetical protein
MIFLYFDLILQARSSQEMESVHVLFRISLNVVGIAKILINQNKIWQII